MVYLSQPAVVTLIVFAMKHWNRGVVLGVGVIEAVSVLVGVTLGVGVGDKPGVTVGVGVGSGVSIQTAFVKSGQNLMLVPVNVPHNPQTDIDALGSKVHDEVEPEQFVK